MPGPIWRPVRRLGIYDVYARDRHSCQVRVLYVILGFFFCKVAGKNPWSRVVVFWAYFKRYGCLFGKSDKRLHFFIYVHHILQYID